MNSQTKEKWNSISTKRRAGVAVPLFSIWSKSSVGIGEIIDLKHIIKWCKQSGLSIIQLLPMNDTGDDFAPYNSISSFALDPMYLTIKELKDVNLLPFKEQIKNLKKKYKPGISLVNYEVKKAKLELLRDIFLKSYVGGITKYEKFKKQNNYWLEDYILFKIIKEENKSKCWEVWDEGFKNHDDEVLYNFRIANQKKYEFYCWVQWQLFEQLSLIKNYAMQNEVFLMGDIPFLVNRDSADVWAHQNYFKLNLSSGAPPDMYFANGQRWGMPPYDWNEIKNNNYNYIRERLKYAENFYNLFRIDHFVGLFRVWTIDNNVPIERGGLDGQFDPVDESLWKSNGESIINILLESSSMLPCAEDLGVVPICSFEVLKEYFIPGTDVQRWVKERNTKYDFISPLDYRDNSISTLSTHDSSGIIEWWQNEAGTIDEKLFSRLCIEKGIKAETFYNIVDILFNSEHKGNGRLLWKKEIDSIEKLLSILELPADRCYDIISIYLDSYNEKSKYLKYLDIEDKIEELIINTDFIYKAILKSSETNSIFSIQMLNDWLCLDENFCNSQVKNPIRINYPGVVNNENWRCVIPIPLENFQYSSINKIIFEINKKTNRI